MTQSHYPAWDYTSSSDGFPFLSQESTVHVITSVRSPFLVICRNKGSTPECAGSAGSRACAPQQLKAFGTPRHQAAVETQTMGPGRTLGLPEPPATSPTSRQGPPIATPLNPKRNDPQIDRKVDPHLENVLEAVPLSSTLYEIPAIPAIMRLLPCWKRH